MNIEERKSGELVVLKPLTKNFDSAVSITFKQKVQNLSEEGSKFFVLNLSQIDFVDSGGLDVLISVLKIIEKHKGDVVLCELQDNMLDLLRLTRLNNIFKVYPTEAEGLKFFGAGIHLFS